MPQGAVKTEVVLLIKTSLYFIANMHRSAEHCLSVFPAQTIIVKVPYRSGNERADREAKYRLTELVHKCWCIIVGQHCQLPLS